MRGTLVVIMASPKEKADRSGFHPLSDEATEQLPGLLDQQVEEVATAP